jgi:predicted transposase/invertase (TIGR01784 family)
MNRLNPRVHFVFKLLFGSEENKDLLISLINSVVSEQDQVMDVLIKNPFNAKTYLQDKLSILDIRAQGKSGKHYNVEIQITDQLHYEKRALYYWSEVYSAQMEEGKAYSELNKTIGIHILNFNLMDEPDYHNRYCVMNTKSNKQAFCDFELHTIELEKFDKEISQVKTALDRWVTFLKKSYELKENQLPKNLQDPFLKKAVHVLDTVNFTQEERLLYAGQLRWLRDEAAGIEKAFLKGELKGKLEEKRAIAKAMKAKGIAIAGYLDSFHGLRPAGQPQDLPPP